MARAPEEHCVVSSAPDSDEELFTEFFRANYQRALSLVRFRTTGCDCEALVADAFLLAWRHLGETGELGAAWLFVVLRNKIGDFYRSSQSAPTADDSVHADADADAVDMAQRSDTRLDVQRVLEALPAAYCEPLVLVYWCEFTGPEAARVLGIREGAFRMKLHRAQKAFLRAFDQRPTTEEA